MRLSAMKNARGSVTVFVMLAMPFVIAMLALVVCVGQVSLARARLQMATDRTAFAGASSLANSLNEATRQNWNLHKAYRDLKREYDKAGQQGEQAAKEVLNRYEVARDTAFKKVDEALGNMSARADTAALATFKANAPCGEPSLDIQNGVVFSVENDPDAQWADVTYYHVEGGSSFIDPASVEGGKVRVLRYLSKIKGSDARIGVTAKQTVTPLVMPSIFGGRIDVFAESRAEAFGGNSEEFAQKATDTAEEAEGILTDGSDSLYRAALAPVRRE